MLKNLATFLAKNWIKQFNNTLLFLKIKQDFYFLLLFVTVISMAAMIVEFFFRLHNYDSFNSLM